MLKQREKGKEWIRSSKVQLTWKKDGFLLALRRITLCPSRTPCRGPEGKRKLLFLLLALGLRRG